MMTSTICSIQYTCFSRGWMVCSTRNQECICWIKRAWGACVSAAPTCATPMSAVWMRRTLPARTGVCWQWFWFFQYVPIMLYINIYIYTFGSIGESTWNMFESLRPSNWANPRWRVSLDWFIVRESETENLAFPHKLTSLDVLVEP